MAVANDDEKALASVSGSMSTMEDGVAEDIDTESEDGGSVSDDDDDDPLREDLQSFWAFRHTDWDHYSGPRAAPWRTWTRGSKSGPPWRAPRRGPRERGGGWLLLHYAAFRGFRADAIRCISRHFPHKAAHAAEAGTASAARGARPK
jgi:hypothetical protein